MSKVLQGKDFPKNNVEVGENTYYNGDIFIKGRGHIKIGKYCAFGDNLRILAGNNHNYNFPAIQVSFFRQYFGGKYPGALPDAGVYIGNDVWIGDNVTVLDGSIIGDGCCIAAGAVIKGRIPNYSIAGGVPAKIIKGRFNKEVANFLSEIAWWEWSEEKIKRNKNFFYSDLNRLAVVDILNMIN